MLKELFENVTVRSHDKVIRKEGLKRLDGQQINHQVCQKVQEMILIALYYNILKNYFTFIFGFFSHTCT